MVKKITPVEAALQVLRDNGYELPAKKEQESLDLENFDIGEDKGEEPDLGEGNSSTGQLEYINSAHYGMRIKLDPKYRRSHARISGNTMFPASIVAAETEFWRLKRIYGRKLTLTVPQIWLDIFLEMTQSINGEGLKHDVELLKASYRPDYGSDSVGDIFKGG